MFKKFKESAYWKAAVMLLVCGCLLIIFNSWISTAKIGTSLAEVNDVLFPVYTGIILAFLLCPLYNVVVKRAYNSLTAGEVSKATRLDYYVEGERDKRTSDPLDRRKSLNIARAVASVVCLVMVIGIIALLVYTVVPQVIKSCIDLIDNMPERLAALSDWLETNFTKFPALANKVDQLANQGTMDIIEWMSIHVFNSDSEALVSDLSNGVFSAVSSLLDIVIGILIMVYLLNYKEKIFAITRKIIAATCKERTKDNLLEFSSVVNETFIGFIVGRVIDSAIIGVLTYIVLLIFNISFAPMISVIVGVTNVIPFFGPFIGAIPSFMILMLESPKEAFWFLIIILIIQQLDGNVIGPKCVGNAIGIDSFWVLVAVLIGGGLFGFAGMIFSVPVFAVIYRYADKLTIRRLHSLDKPAHTADYFSLDKFGIDKNDINLEDIKENDKAFHKKFRKRASVEEEILTTDEVALDAVLREKSTVGKDAPATEKSNGEKLLSAQELAAEQVSDALTFNPERQQDR